MTILVIENDKEIVNLLGKTFRKEKYACEYVHDEEGGLRMAINGKYGVIILSQSVNKKNKFKICEELRSKSINTPIIILGNTHDVQTCVKSLDSGADDYIVKPFNLEEFCARIRALIRRKEIVESKSLSISDITIDSLKHEVTRAGKIISLTPKEYRLLDTLIKNKGNAITRKQLISEAWGPQFKETNNELNVHIRYLRRKIDTSRTKPLVQTIRGVGYTIRD